MKPVITRFPPSPTGMLHIGSLRTALFNYLYAKKHGGRFVLRIEDTDRERFVEGGTENIIRTLDWAGISPDEGPYITDDGSIAERGENGPYVQSNRLDIYKQYVDQLLEQGNAYYAFDSAEQLDEMRERQRLNKQATRYERESMTNSLTLGEEETKKRIDAGEKYVVRLKVPHDGETTYHDVVRGDITFKNAEIDDQILMKSDGFPTYHMAVVVDDHLMEVTHISRGEEWLPSTPKHIMLYTMLGWDIPTYVHQPLLVNEQKQKLSKRHGDVSVEDFVNKGYIKEALINFVAFLGWNPGTEQEIFSLEELVEAFSFENMSKSAAVFNREKLNWYNKQYMAKMDTKELATLAKPFFDKADMSVSIEDIASVIHLEQQRATTLADFPEALTFMFSDELNYDAELVVWKKDTAEGSKALLTKLHDFLLEVSDWSEASLEEAIKRWITEGEYGVGNVLWPMRTALSGQKNSPGPFEIAAALGKEKSLARLRVAIERLA